MDLSCPTAGTCEKILPIRTFGSGLPHCLFFPPSSQSSPRMFQARATLSWVLYATKLLDPLFLFFWFSPLRLPPTPPPLPIGGESSDARRLMTQDHRSSFALWGSTRGHAGGDRGCGCVRNITKRNLGAPLTPSQCPCRMWGSRNLVSGVYFGVDTREQGACDGGYPWESRRTFQLPTSTVQWCIPNVGPLCV